MVGAGRAVACVFLGGCALFEGPSDYSHDAAPETAPAEAAADASPAAVTDAGGPSSDASPQNERCDAGPVCQCLVKNCSQETTACLATSGCSCGLACASACTDLTCLQACFANAGNEATDFVACYTINCIGDC
jgi:hypothetical protein